MEPLVSVIIPTFNSCKTIEKCLDSIKHQSYLNLEIIVVDKFSTDNTVNIAKNYTNNVNKLNASERAEQKNFGVKKSKGKYVFFVDSDMDLSPKVIENCVKCFKRNESIGGLIIPEISVGNSFWIEVRNYEKCLYEYSKVESARFFRKDLVIKVGGFDETLVFLEESVIHQKIEKLGYDVTNRIESPILHDETDFSFFKHLKKKIYYGETMKLYKNHYDYAEEQLGVVYRSKLLINKKSLKNPILSIPLIFLKALEFIFCEFGLIKSIIERRGSY